MPKAKPVTKISDKLSKVNDNFNIYMYDNGYMMEISGRNHSEDWASAKILVTSLDDLVKLITEASEMDRE
jgi:hypothetical protein